MAAPTGLVPFGLAISLLLSGCSEKTRDRVQEAVGSRTPSLTLEPSVSLSARPSRSPGPTRSEEVIPTSTSAAETEQPAEETTELAQPSAVAATEEEASPWWPIMLFVLILGAIAAGIWAFARRGGQTGEPGR